MRGTRNALTAGALLVTIALGGCGGSGGSSEATSNKAALKKLRPTTKVASVSFASPTIHGGALPATYTCDGKDVPPPIKWGSVPANLHEIALFAFTDTPGKPASVVWAMAGVAPVLHGLVAGEIPRGAFLLSTSSGARRYSICPAKGQSQRYVFGLYALPELVRAAPQIPGPLLLRNLTGRIPQGRSPAEGTFRVTYTRP